MWHKSLIMHYDLLMEFPWRESYHIFSSNTTTDGGRRLC